MSYATRSMILWLTKVTPVVAALILIPLAVFVVTSILDFQKDAIRVAEENAQIGRDVKKILCEGVPESECNLTLAAQTIINKLNENTKLTNCLLIAHGNILDGGIISEEDQERCRQLVAESMNDSTSHSPPAPTEAPVSQPGAGENQPAPPNENTDDPGDGDDGILPPILGPVVPVAEGVINLLP